MNTARFAACVAVAVLLHGVVGAQTKATLSVSAHMDVYRAGGYEDGSDGDAPAVYSFPALPGQLLTFPGVTGTWNCGGGAPFGPDGNPAVGNSSCVVVGDVGATGPFSGLALTGFHYPLAGVFLEDSISGTPPRTLHFTNIAAHSGIPIDFVALNPQIGQVFFIGDGLTGTGSGHTQVFAVPPSATHLYLGFVDSCASQGFSTPGCYYDNSGSLTVAFHFSHL